MRYGPQLSAAGIRRILIVEDELPVAEGITELLKGDGLAVDHYVFGREALANIERLAPDVLLVDLGLPDMSGADLAQQIAARHPDLPIILMTGSVPNQTAPAEVLRLVRGTLEKPFDYPVLVELLLTCGTAPS